MLAFTRSVHVDEHQTDCVLACPSSAEADQHTERSWTFNGQPLGANAALNYRDGRDGSLHLSRKSVSLAEKQHARVISITTV